MTDRPPTFDGVALRGTYYKGKFAVQLARTLVAGDGLYCMREPSNQHDGNAIMISHEGTHIGYAGREYAARIAPWMDAGWLFLCTVQDNYVCGVPTHVHCDLRFTPLGRPQKKVEVEKEKELEDAD